MSRRARNFRALSAARDPQRSGTRFDDDDDDGPRDSTPTRFERSTNARRISARVAKDADVRLLSRDTGHDNWSAARRGESGAISGGFLVRGGVLLKYTHREHRVIRVARDDNNYRA